MAIFEWLDEQYTNLDNLGSGKRPNKPNKQQQKTHPPVPAFHTGKEKTLPEMKKMEVKK